MEADAVQADGGGIPVGGGFNHVDVLAGAPFLEVERTVADERSGAGPAVAALVGRAGFFEGGQVDGPPSPVLEEREKVRRGVSERDADGAVVRRGARRSSVSALEAKAKRTKPMVQVFLGRAAQARVK